MIGSFISVNLMSFLMYVSRPPPLVSSRPLREQVKSGRSGALAV